ncbi:restriction endonuclease subunit S [Bacillus cereus]|nr:restriction endonuclease subunit S [Bacillus cereus]MCU5457146.1 restriction endonuclease subunit S [Bacillus cereus]MCU5547055.1 restriction endonuclease subunit S [Bacillus cereus]MCU5677597.1 restriction endonuclease subunit S [Bacillus cereus]
MGKYKFSDIVYNITDKRVPEPEDKETYIGLEHMDTGSLTINRYGSNVALKGVKLVMKKGDVLFARRNAYLKRAAIAPHDGIFSAHGMIFRPKTEVVNEKFFPFFIASDYFMDTAIQISVGSLSPTVNWGTLKNVEFNLPDVKEQEKLAELLWAAHETKEAYKKLLFLTGDLIQSQFIEMFGDFNTNSMGWEVKQFEEFAKIDAVMTTDYEKYADYPHIGIDSIEKNTGDLKGYRTIKQDNVISSKYIFTANHIIYSKIRPNLNKVALPSFKGLCSADAYPILPNVENCSKYFLATVLRSDFFLSYVLGFSARTNMPKVNRKQITGFTMPLPPLNLQKQFEYHCKQVERSKCELEQVILSLENTITLLMQQYVY